MDNYRQIPFEAVDITGGFWARRQKLNSEVTVPAVENQFKKTGRFDALEFKWKDGMPNKPHIFYDSDIAKWAESVAYLLMKESRPELEAEVDRVVDMIEAHQEPDGYFNSYFAVLEPDQKFQKRTEHELYCLGHLIEAAAAYYKATGKDKFLNLMRKYADLVDRVFRVESSAAFSTPGHEEIELALVKLYEVTGEARYLELSKWFIDRRGRNEDEGKYSFANNRYAQDHVPVREMTTAEGHSVRAMYLFCAMADLARITGDEALLNACRAVFGNTVDRRMYITGGIGSSRYGEAFTVDYDLPNATAYTESCAALALALFARRMLLIDADSRYADAAERTIYNGFMSSTSLDGKCFFYENPLEIDLNRIGKDVSVSSGEVMPIPQRVEVFDCSCCPPNIARFIASIADFLYSAGEDTLFVHHYIESRAAFAACGCEVEVTQRTRYPADGEVRLAIHGLMGKSLCVRVPGYCEDAWIEKSGARLNCAVNRGYARIPVDEDELEVTLHFDMPIALYEAHGKVHADAGRVALMRGPVVYCVEGVDHEGELSDYMVDEDLSPELEASFDGYLPAVSARGFRRRAADPEALYQKLNSTLEPVRMRFIPYFAFANREKTDMQVWVLLKR